MLLLVPQTWGSAFGAGFIYTAGQQYTKRPFLERVGCVFPFVTAKLNRLGVLHLEQGSSIPQGNEIQTVLFKGGSAIKKRSWRLRFLFEFELLWFEDGG